MTATETTYTEFTAGQKVRSVFGETFIVSEQNGCMVYVEGRSDHFHPSKLYPAFDGQTARKRVGGTMGS